MKNKWFLIGLSLLLIGLILRFTLSGEDGENINHSTINSINDNIILVMFGPPAAGKGTQSERLSEYFNLPHISSGNIFRTNIAEETELGLQVKEIIDAGELVPDDLVNSLILGELDNPDFENGFILDGFPRTIAQAEVFDQYLEDKGQTLTGVIFLDVSYEESKRRVLGRDDDRADDEIDVFENRWDVYRSESEPMINYYRDKNKLIHINGLGSIEEVFNRIKDSVQSRIES